MLTIRGSLVDASLLEGAWAAPLLGAHWPGGHTRPLSPAWRALVGAGGGKAAPSAGRGRGGAQMREGRGGGSPGDRPGRGRSGARCWWGRGGVGLETETDQGGVEPEDKVSMG